MSLNVVSSNLSSVHEALVSGHLENEHCVNMQLDITARRRVAELNEQFARLQSVRRMLSNRESINEHPASTVERISAPSNSHRVNEQPSILMPSRSQRLKSTSVKEQFLKIVPVIKDRCRLLAVSSTSSIRR